MRSRFSYVLNETEKYEDCIPIKIGAPDGSKTIYMPPWETAQFCLDDVVTELVSVQKAEYSFLNPRIDKEGRIFYMKILYDKKAKKIADNARSIPELLEDLRKNGYNISDKYWYEHAERLRHT